MSSKLFLSSKEAGDHIDIVQAALFSSPHWPLFQRHILLENMRLARVTDPIEQAQQTAYDEMIRAVGENRHVDNLLIFQEPPEGQDVPVSMKERIYSLRYSKRKYFRPHSRKNAD